MYVKRPFQYTASITTRLSLFYTIATFTLVMIISVFLYWGMVNILYSADRQFLSDEIDVIASILSRQSNDSAALQQEISDIPRSLKTPVYRYYLRVLDNNGKIIDESPEMSTVFWDNKFFTSFKVPAGIQHQWWQSATHHSFLLMQRAINIEKANQSFIIQAALDVSYQQSIIKHYRKNVIIILIISAFLSAFLGYIIARRGMRHLYKLTKITEQITANALEERIDPKSWPKELNELGEAYNQMLDRIETSIFRLSKFSDDLAHELRTPITNLMGEIEVVLTHDHSITRFQQVMESNLEELNRLHQIIENLLFLARAENPQLDLQKTPLDVHHEINVIFEFYQALADEKNIQLNLAGEATVFANSIMFRRMISNILSNSLKYSPCNSLVQFNVEELAHQMIRITLIDHGIGIDSEHIPLLCTRFFRADSARTQLEGGTGLGLAIVKSIVDLHGGRLSITSEVNKGTVIVIDLPK